MTHNALPLALSNAVLGTAMPQRRHVALILGSMLLYVVPLCIMWHACYLNLLDEAPARRLTWLGVAMCGIVYTLVRSGWSQRFEDPLLTFPHAAAAITLCIAAYTQLGDLRANVMLFIAQAIVAAMLSLPPRQTATLGLYTVVLLGCVITGMTWYDGVEYLSTTAVTHFAVAGPTLLTLAMVAKWVGEVRVRIGEQAKQLSNTLTTLQRMASHDGVTGLFNRRVMTEMIEAELRLLDRHGGPLCVAVLDLDHFKRINDERGHQAGDHALRAFGEHLQVQLRQVDKLARWGGEEFIVMLPHATMQEARLALERLKTAMPSLRVPDYVGLQLRFSAGLAQAEPGETLESLLDRADQALYAAKQNGRNRIELAPNAGQPTQEEAR